MPATETTAKPRKPRTSFGTLGFSKATGKYYPSYIGLDKKRYRSPSSFSTKAQAQKWLAAQLAAMEAAEWDPSTAQEIAGRFVPARAKPVIFEEFALDVIRKSKTRRGLPLASRTTEEYERLVRTSLLPFHGRDLRYITADDVDTWWDEILDEVDADGQPKLTTAAHAYDRLKSTMNRAVELKVIRANPVHIPGASSLRTGKKLRKPHDHEIVAVLEHLPLRWRALFVCEAWGALRFGEVTELRRRDIALGQRITKSGDSLLPTAVIHVTRAVSWIKGGAVVKAPKSEAGVRQVPLSTGAALLLTQFLASELAPKGRDDLLWTSLQGKGHLRYSVYWRMWSNAVEAAGVEYFNPHALRHYAATLYAQAGATLKELQAILGQSTPQAAMKYQHAAEDRLVELSDRAEETAAAGIERQRKAAALQSEIEARRAAAAAEIAALEAQLANT